MVSDEDSVEKTSRGNLRSARGQKRYKKFIVSSKKLSKKTTKNHRKYLQSKKATSGTDEQEIRGHPMVDKSVEIHTLSDRN